MNEVVKREIERHRLRRHCFRVLAKHTQDTLEQKLLFEMVKDEDAKIAEMELQNEVPGEPISLEAHRWLTRTRERT